CPTPGTRPRSTPSTTRTIGEGHRRSGRQLWPHTLRQTSAAAGPAVGHTGHEGHGHGVSPGADRRKLITDLALIIGFMVVEVVVAVVSGSLALISDAGHMLTDAGAIGASLWAIRLAARPARGVWTFGWKRAEILSAAVNGLTLLVVGALVAFEAIRRLIQPPPVAGGSVLVVALARGGGEPGCRVGPGQGEPVKLERPWCLSAHPDR